jgi:hypothetical protein
MNQWAKKKISIDRQIQEIGASWQGRRHSRPTSGGWKHSYLVAYKGRDYHFVTMDEIALFVLLARNPHVSLHELHSRREEHAV